MDEGGLWVSPAEARQRIGAFLETWQRPRISIAEISAMVFGMERPDRSASTQIGKALALIGWRRVEQRTKKPRYVYEPA